MPDRRFGLIPRLVTVVGAIGVVILLSLSDRAPSALGSIARTAVANVAPVWAASILSGLVRVVPVASDTIGHALVWAFIALLSGGLVRSALGRLGLAIGLVAVSALVEVGQQFATWSRSASMSDLAANIVGVTVGLSACVLVRHSRSRLSRLRPAATKI